MSISQFLRILWVRRWIIIVSTAACFAAGLLAVLIVPRTYEATARVLLDVAKSDPLEPNTISFAFARTYIPSEAEFIMSYRVGARVAENLGMTQDPALRAQYDGFVASQTDRNNLPTIGAWLGSTIAGNVEAKQYMATNVIDITYRGRNPDDAATMANAVRQAYLDETQAEQRNQATQAVGWLDRQMSEISKQREDAQQRSVAYQKANGIVLLNGGADAASSQLQAIAQAAPVGGSTLVGGSNPNAAQLAALDARIATESEQLGPNHPIIQDLRAQRAALARAPTGGPRSVSGPSQASLIASQGAKVLAQQDKVGEAKRLQANVDALTTQYQTMAAREAALRQQMNGNAFSIVMLDAAEAPKHPVAPRPLLILIGSFGFGLAIGVLIALILEFVRRRVRGVEDLLGTTNVPVIGVIDAPPVPLAA
jgi:succinoglycan biosynthesis transport protein ExoP